MKDEIGYLSHPFHNRHAIRKWELDIEKRLGISLLNPFYDNDRDGEIEKIDSGEIEKYEIDPDTIVSRDLQAINDSDYLVAIIDGTVSYGTIMEIVYAFAWGIPVYIICSNGHHRHPWLQYHAIGVYTTLEEFEREVFGQPAA